MKQPPDLAPKRRPPATRANDETLAQGAERLADALPIPIVVRHENGQVAFLNDAARKELGVESYSASEMTLTIILRGAEDAPDANVYLLSVERDALVRLVARAHALDLGLERGLEALVVEPTRARLEESVESRAEATRSRAARRPIPTPRPRRRLRSAAGVVFHPRQLLACAARRLLRQFGGDIELAIAAAPTKRCDRRVRLDEIAFAEVLLNSAAWIFSRTAKRTLALSACASSHRLRVSLEGPARRGSDAPESDSEHDWLRAVRPFVDAHRATVEVHDDSERVGIVISLPILR